MHFWLFVKISQQYFYVFGTYSFIIFTFDKMIFTFYNDYAQYLGWQKKYASIFNCANE